MNLRNIEVFLILASSVSVKTKSGSSVMLSTTFGDDIVVHIIPTTYAFIGDNVLAWSGLGKRPQIKHGSSACFLEHNSHTGWPQNLTKGVLLPRISNGSEKKIKK